MAVSLKAFRFRIGSHEENRYSIVPLPEDVGLTRICSEEMKGIIDKMTPQSASAPQCATHPKKKAMLNCRTCRDQLICDRCHSESHIGHSIEHINETYQRIQNRLMTAKRNMDKINDRCRIVNDENQNEENQIVSLFDKLQSDFKDSQDVVYKRLEGDEDELKHFEKEELKNITYSKEADERLYEVEAIEKMTEIEEKIEALERQKKGIQESLAMRLEEREVQRTEQLDTLKKQVEDKMKSSQGIRERLEMNAQVFERLYSALKSVSDAHANQCRETISTFLERYREITTKVAAFDNGSASFDFLQDLSNLTSESHSDSIAQDSFVLEIPQVHYKASEESLELGQFVLYPGDEERQKLQWSRAPLKTWYVENISGLSNQLIAAVTRKRGSRETYLDILKRTGDQLVSHRLTKRFADSFHFVCAVSPHKIAICCESEINTMNIYDGKIEETYRLQKGEEVWQIAYNRSQSEILVGLVGTNELRVFDENLQPLRSVLVSTTTRAPLSLAASEDSIFVCTYENRAFILDGKVGTVKTTFHRNGIENRAWRICCDSLKMVYVMWLRREGVVSVVRYDMKGVPYSCLDVESCMRFLGFAQIQNGAEQLIVASEDGEFHINRTPSKIEDAMVRAVDDISLSKYLGVLSIWRLM